MTKAFKDMDRDKQAEVVSKGMAAGGSYKSLAAKYGVGVGQIAGICRDYNIPSTHKAPTMGTSKAPKPLPTPPPPPPEPPPAPVEPPEPPPAPKPYVPTHKPVQPAHERTRYKMAATEATQCIAHDENNLRCGYEREPESMYCRLPQHQKLQY